MLEFRPRGGLVRATAPTGSDRKADQCARRSFPQSSSRFERRLSADDRCKRLDDLGVELRPAVRVELGERYVL
jgi:hypothetical protein